MIIFTNIKVLYFLQKILIVIILYNKQHYFLYEKIRYYFLCVKITEVHFSVCYKCGFMSLYKACEGFLKAKGYKCSVSEGQTGDFEVTVGDKLVYSKRATGVKPIPPQVLKALQDAGF